LQDYGTANPVFIGGDVHSYWVTDIKADWQNPDSATIATEFVGTSITSGGGDMDTYNALLPHNPHVRHIETRERGYVLCEVTPEEWRATHRSMPDASVVDPNATLSAARSFVVENGTAGAQRS
jgi:alkaline phosphatase D